LFLSGVPTDSYEIRVSENGGRRPEMDRGMVCYAGRGLACSNFWESTEKYSALLANGRPDDLARCSGDHRTPTPVTMLLDRLICRRRRMMAMNGIDLRDA
jgi:hypothetical protein